MAQSISKSRASSQAKGSAGEWAVAGIDAERVRREPLWTSPDRPVVCWEAYRRGASPLWFHTHADMEATVVLEGDQEIVYLDARVACAPGDMWFAAIGEVHGYRTSGMTNICLAFSPDFLGDSMLGSIHWLTIFAQPPEGRPRVVRADQRRQMLSVGWQIYQEATMRQPGWEAALRIHLLQALLTVTRGWAPSDQGLEAGARRVSALLPALQLVCARSKTGERVSTGEAAYACAMSRSHFSRTFHSGMGRPFSQFEAESRLAVAARLLRGTQLAIRGVALRTGFWDSSHLTHQFTARYGISPRAFRSAGAVTSRPAA